VILIAPDSFKGTMTAAEVAAAIARGVARGGGVPDVCPLADGGEGTLDALREVLGLELRTAPAHDPIGRPIRARYGFAPASGVALVETAAASGLTLVARERRDAWAASTRGTGELIAAALRDGARIVLVAAGGSAATDGGAGALAAIEAAGGLGGAGLIVLCDVTVSFERAAPVFAPQKGAGAAVVAALARRLDELARTFARDPRGVPMTGAAGGLSGGLWASLGATLAPGAAWVLDALGLDARLRAADAVITGEGRLDAQSLEGKLVGEVARRARRFGVPVHAFVGGCALGGGQVAALGLAGVVEAGTPAALEAVGATLARELREVCVLRGRRRDGRRQR